MGWEKICPRLKDLISHQAAVLIQLQAALQVSCLPAARWIVVDVDFNKHFASSFSVSISQVGQDRERSGKKTLFPWFKVDWGQQWNQRPDLLAVPIEAVCASRTDPGSGLLVHMNNPFQLLINTKHGFAYLIHLQTHRFTEQCQESYLSIFLQLSG